MGVANMARETTLTTGDKSNAYVLEGAVDHYSDFANALALETGDAFGPWSDVWYVCWDDAGNFECGRGTLTGGPDTLTRDHITDPDDGNSPNLGVVWGAGSKHIAIVSNFEQLVERFG